MRKLLRKAAVVASLTGMFIASGYAAIAQQTIYLNFDDINNIQNGTYEFGQGSQYYQNLFFNGHAGVTLTTTSQLGKPRANTSALLGLTSPAPSSATPNNGSVALSFFEPFNITAVPNPSDPQATPTALIAGIEFWYYQGSLGPTVTGLTAGGTNVQIAGCPIPAPGDPPVPWCDSGLSMLNVGTYETIGNFSGVRSVTFSGATGSIDAVTLLLVYDSGNDGGGGGLPEPGSIALTTAALGGALIFTRRKKVIRK